MGCDTRDKGISPQALRTELGLPLRPCWPILKSLGYFELNLNLSQVWHCDGREIVDGWPGVETTSQQRST